jgi:hypothetical protein
MSGICALMAASKGEVGRDDDRELSLPGGVPRGLSGLMLRPGTDDVRPWRVGERGAGGWAWEGEGEGEGEGADARAGAGDEDGAEDSEGAIAEPDEASAAARSSAGVGARSAAAMMPRVRMACNSGVKRSAEAQSLTRERAKYARCSAAPSARVKGVSGARARAIPRRAKDNGTACAADDDDAVAAPPTPMPMRRSHSLCAGEGTSEPEPAPAPAPMREAPASTWLLELIEIRGGPPFPAPEGSPPFSACAKLMRPEATPALHRGRASRRGHQRTGSARAARVLLHTHEREAREESGQKVARCTITELGRQSRRGATFDSEVEVAAMAEEAEAEAEAEEGPPGMERPPDDAEEDAEADMDASASQSALSFP